MKKRILSFALVLCMVFTLLPMSAFADDIVASGKCGDNLTWQLNSEGTLAIAGSGKMYNFEFGGCPWYSFRLDIKSIVIEEGITRIGYNAFAYCIGLTIVTIPDNIISIDGNAFSCCSNLTSITIPDTIWLLIRKIQNED